MHRNTEDSKQRDQGPKNSGWIDRACSLPAEGSRHSRLTSSLFVLSRILTQKVFHECDEWYAHLVLILEPPCVASGEQGLDTRWRLLNQILGQLGAAVWVQMICGVAWDPFIHAAVSNDMFAGMKLNWVFRMLMQIVWVTNEAINTLVDEALFNYHQGQIQWRRKWLGWFAKDVEEGNCHCSLSWFIVESWWRNWVEWSGWFRG